MSAVDTALQKPKLRGVSHEIAFYVSLCAGIALALNVPPSIRATTIVYAASLAFLFGVSALYHRPTWSPRARAWMRRLDHAAIYVLIAGTFTPFSNALDPDSARTLLVVAWGGATAGFFQSLFWAHAPKPVSAVLYVALGWAILPFMSRIAAVTGATGIVLMAAGGVTYTVGAIIYAMKRPNPVPGWFGYHEVFHALVVVAAALHFGSVLTVLSPLAP